MRFEHWETRLGAIVEMYRRKPFEWGRHDCVLFGADCVWAITQRDPAATWRRTYSDEAGAARILVAAGGFVPLIETGLASIGVPIERIAPSFAQRGDPVLFDAPGFLGGVGPAVGIVLGETFAAKGLEGLEHRPVAMASQAWAIR